jgi:hypothetical protein
LQQPVIFNPLRQPVQQYTTSERGVRKAERQADNLSKKT